MFYLNNIIFIETFKKSHSFKIKILYSSLFDLIQVQYTHYVKFELVLIVRMNLLKHTQNP